MNPLEYNLIAWGIIYAVFASSLASTTMAVYLRFMFPEKYRITMVGWIVGTMPDDTLNNLTYPVMCFVISMQACGRFVVYMIGTPLTAVVLILTIVGWIISFFSTLIPPFLLRNIMSPQDMQVLDRSPKFMEWIKSMKVRAKNGIKLSPFKWSANVIKEE